jgi:membrane fusion protein, heavy metal efflux system
MAAMIPADAFDNLTSARGETMDSFTQESARSLAVLDWRSEMQRKRIAAIAAVSFVLGLALAWGLGKYGAAPGNAASNGKAAEVESRANPFEVKLNEDASQLAQIRTTPATVSEIPMVEPLAARFAYDESATTRISSPIAGRIGELVAKPGDAVKAGQVLARVDSADFGSAVSDADKARADAQRKKAALDRSQAMFEAGLLAKRDLESAQADWQQADAELRRAQSRLATLNVKAGAAGARRFGLVSPIAGVVVERKANPGMEVRPDLPDPLFVVSDLKKLWGLVDVPEQSLHAVLVGSLVSFDVAAYPGREFLGKVDFLSPVLDPATRRIQARVAIDNGDGLLRPEMYAKALVSGREGRKAIRMPISALVSAGERSYVFVERAPGVFEKQPVELAAQNRDFAYAVRGVEVGDRIVTAGAVLLDSELATKEQ